MNSPPLFLENFSTSNFPSLPLYYRVTKTSEKVSVEEYQFSKRGRFGRPFQSAPILIQSVNKTAQNKYLFYLIVGVGEGSHPYKAGPLTTGMILSTSKRINFCSNVSKTMLIIQRVGCYFFLLSYQFIYLFHCCNFDSIVFSRLYFL